MFFPKSAPETQALNACLTFGIAFLARPVLRNHWRPLIQGSLSIVVCYALFYIATVYTLGYGVQDAPLLARSPA